jgi:hypothetical protein
MKRLGEPRPALTVVLALFYFAAAVSRRPSTLLQPQFWAEDGALFYQQPRGTGFLPTLVSPYGGYLHTLPRLTAGISLLLPLSYGPLLFNLVALVTQSLPAILLCTARMDHIGPLAVRILLGFLYIAVPNVPRVLGNLTNAQWHLAVLSFLIVVASPPRSVWAAVFDVVALSIGAVTGPFAAFLFPLAAVLAWSRRDTWALARAGILLLGALTLPVTTLMSVRPVPPSGLGASVPAFCNILTFQVFFPVLRGMNEIVHYAQQGWLPTVSYAATAIGFAFLAYAFVRGGVELRCFLVFAALVLASSLASPLASGRDPQWISMQKPDAPSRYWIIPEVAVAAAVVSVAATAQSRLVRLCGAALVCMMLIADVTHWRLPDLPDRHFDDYVAAFKAAPVGTHLRIPIPPNWTFEVVKTERD